LFDVRLISRQTGTSIQAIRTLWCGAPILGFSVGRSLIMSDNFLATCAALPAFEAKRPASRREPKTLLRGDKFSYHALSPN
jgi:hypothetical protein